MAASSSEGNSDDLSAKLAGELRDYVRALGPFTLFSREWFDMVESLQHLTNIALMEQLLPKASATATLWERDELTVRFLLEEGKLNLCLRLLQEFKEYMTQHNPNTVIVQASAVGVRMDWPQLRQQIDVFEQSMGLLVNCAFKSVESLQTIDLPLLIRHIGDMLSYVKKNPESLTTPEIEKRQESLVILYLLSLLRRLDDLQEDLIMSEIERREICASLIQVLHQSWSAVPKQVVVACCQVLHLLMDSEAFKTHPEKYIPEDLKEKTVELHTLFIQNLFKEYEARKRIQALLGVIDKFKIQLGMDL